MPNPNAGGASLEENLGLEGSSSASGGGVDRDVLADIWGPGESKTRPEDDVVGETGDGDTEEDGEPSEPNQGGSRTKATPSDQDDSDDEGETEPDASDEQDQDDAGEESHGGDEDTASALADLRAVLRDEPVSDRRGEDGGQSQDKPGESKIPELGKVGDLFDEKAIKAINAEAGEPEDSQFGKAVAKAASSVAERIIGNLVPHIQAIGGAIGPVLREHAMRQNVERQQALTDVVGFFNDLADSGFEKLVGRGEKVRPSQFQIREEICQDAAKIRERSIERGKNITWRRAVQLAAAMNDRIGEKALSVKGKGEAGKNATASTTANGKAIDGEALRKRQAQVGLSTSRRGEVRQGSHQKDPKREAAKNWIN